jgi:gamma-butyrobetaine dioxygenase
MPSHTDRALFKRLAGRQAGRVTMVRASHIAGFLPTAEAVLHGTGVRYSSIGRHADLHPNWLRDQSQEPGQVETTNRQRLFTPSDIADGLTVTSCRLDGEHLVVGFSDQHVARIRTELIELRLGWLFDEEQPPAPEPWTTPLERFPYVDWNEIGWSLDDEDTDAVIEFLSAFYRHGYVVLRNTPTVEGTLRRITDRLGYIVGNNFGWIFDVRAEPNPTDLAYTSIELLAHTDQPYRRPVPGIQLLHCLRNEAPGGDSTLVDGLAAADALLAEHPDLHAALVETEVEFRYDMGTDTVVNRGHILTYDRHGRYRQVCFNTKLDSPVLRPGLDLDAFYAGRRWLAEWLNDPAHQVTFRLEPGDVMFMDNHRALHGRTRFDSSQGHRHLQGGYIEHDGPDTMYRLAVRRRRASMSA